MKYRRRQCACALAMVILASIGSSPAAGDMTISRWVQFRDGSLLRVELPDAEVTIHTLTDDGDFAASSARLSEIERIDLVPRSPTTQLPKIEAAIERLGDPSYETRQQATAELFQIAIGFHRFVSARRDREENLEIAARLTAVCERLAFEQARYHSRFDELIRSKRPIVQVDLRDWSIVGRHRGLPVTVNRQTAESVRTERPEADQAENVRHVHRIDEDDEMFGPPYMTRVDFEKDPKGQPLEEDENVEQRFIDWGVTFETSVANSFLAVNNYAVESRSGKQSAANRLPLYEGVTTIRFCKPGDTTTPAAVRTAGLYVAEVVKNGTALQAFDANDRMIGEVKTTNIGSAFLALRSDLPIAKLRIWPNPNLDDNYTFDDLFFDTPRPAAAEPAIAGYNIETADGQQYACKRIAFEGDRIVLGGLVVDAEDIKLPMDSVVRIDVRRNDWRPVEIENGFWLQTRPGSVLWCHRDDGFHWHRDAQIELASDQVAAIWSANHALTRPDTNRKLNRFQFICTDGRQPGVFSKWQFGEKSLTADGETTDGRFLVDGDWPYDELPSIWFAPLATGINPSRAIELTTGERIALSEGGFKLESITNNEIKVSREDSQFSIPWSQVISLQLASP